MSGAIGDRFINDKAEIPLKFLKQALKSTLFKFIDKNSSFYLQETDLIRGGASAASTLEVTISFEVIDDA